MCKYYIILCQGFEHPQIFLFKGKTGTNPSRITKENCTLAVEVKHKTHEETRPRGQQKLHDGGGSNGISDSGSSIDGGGDDGSDNDMAMATITTMEDMGTEGSCLRTGDGEC